MPYTLEKSNVFAAYDSLQCMDEIVGRLHPAFSFDLSRVFCQGATMPLHPRKVETSLQNGAARGKEIVIARTRGDLAPRTQNGVRKKALLKRVSKCARVSCPF